MAFDLRNSTLGTAVDTATEELVMRETASRNLRGIPAQQNQTRIERLYDELNHLHIQILEEVL